MRKSALARLGRPAGTFSLLALTLLGACRLPSPSEAPLAGRARSAGAMPAIVAAPVPKAVAAAPAAPVIPSAATDLDRALNALGAEFGGSVGLAVRDVQTGWTSTYRGLDYFPQQSVSKLWVAITAFDLADRGGIDLAASQTVGRDDLTLFHQPIRAEILRAGAVRTTLDELLIRALTQSDNTANQAVLSRVGGPDAVRAMLSSKSLLGVRFGPGERLLQSQIAGIEWKADYSIGNGFYGARDAVAPEKRRAAFEAYIADPIDGVTPLAMVDALARLKSGELLSSAASERMLSIMAQTRTGAQRLKGALLPGWALSHKTGTGQVLDGEQAGYNDVGVLTAPDGKAYTIAVLIGRTARPLGDRMALMQRVVAATIDYHAKLGVQQSSGSDTPHAASPAN